METTNRKRSTPGHWNDLDNESQRPRYQRIGELCRDRSVLDVGCGTAILREFVDGAYTGVEPNATAAAVARANAPGCKIICASAEKFAETEEQWPIIVFNESLYYSQRAAWVLPKYIGKLQPGGMLIVSIYMRRTSLLSRLLRIMNNQRCAAMVDRKLVTSYGRLVREDIEMPGSDEHWRIWALTPTRR